MTSPLEQKIRITGPSIVTANRTFDGAVIYRNASQGWSTELAEAAIVWRFGPSVPATGVSVWRLGHPATRTIHADPDGHPACWAW